VPLPACRFCDEWVQITYDGGQVVFGRKWAQIVYKYDLHYGDFVEFKLQAFVLKMIIYKADYSTARLYIYPDHG
jgi:hypothetical protein